MRFQVGDKVQIKEEYKSHYPEDYHREFLNTLTITDFSLYKDRNWGFYKAVNNFGSKCEFDSDTFERKWERVD